MGRDLMAGHVHRDRYGRSPAPAASHRPAGKKRMQQAVSDRSPKRAEAPEIPRLRALEAQAAAIPISSSAASSTSPRSGSSRVNPYPVGEATESSPFEIVPSVATQATHSWEQGGSLDLTPIRDDTSPTTPSNKPIQGRLFSQGNQFQLQIQSRAARRMIFHDRDRSVGILGRKSLYRFSLEFEGFSLQIQTSGSTEINSVISSATTVFAARCIPQDAANFFTSTLPSLPAPPPSGSMAHEHKQFCLVIAWVRGVLLTG